MHWARRWPQCYRSQCLVRAARDGDKDAQAAEGIVKRIGIPWHALVFPLSFFPHPWKMCLCSNLLFPDLGDLKFLLTECGPASKRNATILTKLYTLSPITTFQRLLYITASWKSNDCAHQHCHLVVPSVVIHCYILESHVYRIPSTYWKMPKLFAVDFGSHLAWTKDMSCKVATSQHGHRTSWVIFPVMKNHDRLNYPGPMNPTILLMPTCTTTANDVWCQSLQPIGFHKVKGVEPKVQTGPNPICHVAHSRVGKSTWMGFKHGKPLRSFWIHSEQAAGEMFGCLCYAVVVRE